MNDPGRACAERVAWDLADEGSSRLFNMKYLRHKTLGFILFEPSVRHDDVAATLGGKDQIVSAGFVFAPAADLKCLGHSSSLQLAAAPNDEHDLRTRMIVM
jgi:hypothetical protein